MVKNPPANARTTGDESVIPGSGRSPRGENGNQLQYSCWEIPGTEEPVGLQSMGLRVGHDHATEYTYNAYLLWCP